MKSTLGWDEQGGSAFPAEGGSDSGLYADPGISKRDYFATHAFNQMLRWEAAEGSSYEEIAEQAYMAADAMLKASGRYFEKQQ